nr:hypothetical protein Iba_chr14aCG25730 [Ipomoea batatas]
MFSFRPIHHYLVFPAKDAPLYLSRTDETEYAEYSIWDDQYEDFPPAGETLESFHNPPASAQMLYVAEVVEVERNSIEATVAIDARDKSVAVTVSKRREIKHLMIVEP